METRAVPLLSVSAQPRWAHGGGGWGRSDPYAVGAPSGALAPGAPPTNAHKPGVSFGAHNPGRIRKRKGEGEWTLASQVYLLPLPSQWGGPELPSDHLTAPLRTSGLRPTPEPPQTAPVSHWSRLSKTLGPSKPLLPPSCDLGPWGPGWCPHCRTLRPRSSFPPLPYRRLPVDPVLLRLTSLSF